MVDDLDEDDIGWRFTVGIVGSGDLIWYAARAEVNEAGALLFFDDLDELTRAVGPGMWRDVEREP